MESAITSEATPAVTPTTEIAVITPITACLRLARRYRAATKSSNLTRTPHADGGSCGCPLKGNRHQRHASFVLAKALAKPFFQFVFLNPDHQRKCSQQADAQQNEAYGQAAANRPARKIQQVRNVNGMAHSCVQSRGDQLLRVFVRPQLSLTAELVRAEARI